ncbi:twin-arginine translocation signal domain-containing protein [bacterium]|nr:twin-arginine translocation signal domain-containing protein [bacterium]
MNDPTVQIERSGPDVVVPGVITRSVERRERELKEEIQALQEVIRSMDVIMSTRRDFLKNLSLGAVVAAMWPAKCTAGTENIKGELPTISLGKLEVSRLILGSNPFFGFDHGNPQASGDKMREYYTEERVMAVMDQAAEHSITAVWTPCYEHWIRVWNRYREKGGKLKIWIAQPDRLPMEREIKIAVKNGSKAIAIQGIRIDDQVKDGKWDVGRGWLELIKSHGLPAGMATHRATTHLEAEDRGLPADFYHQTLYRPDNYVREGLEESLATIEKLHKPVVAYKVFGAGRILPKDTLPYVFKRLKPKDGICVGVFPKKRDEIAENSSLTLKLSRRAPRQSDL